MATQIVIANKEHIAIDDDFIIDVVLNSVKRRSFTVKPIDSA